MTNTMTYKGYTARVEYDPRDEIFIGRVLGIEDRITFHGATPSSDPYGPRNTGLEYWPSQKDRD